MSKDPHPGCVMQSLGNVDEASPVAILTMLWNPLSPGSCYRDWCVTPWPLLTPSFLLIFHPLLSLFSTQMWMAYRFMELLGEKYLSLLGTCPRTAISHLFRKLTETTIPVKSACFYAGVPPLHSPYALKEEPDASKSISHPWGCSLIFYESHSYVVFHLLLTTNLWDDPKLPFQWKIK